MHVPDLTRNHGQLNIERDLQGLISSLLRRTGNVRGHCLMAYSLSKVVGLNSNLCFGDSSRSPRGVTILNDTVCGKLSDVLQC